MELEGKIIAVLEARSGVSPRTGSPWMVQSYVLETHEQYPRRMCFDIFGEDKITQSNVQVGQELKVSFDIDAREYQGRWYNSIRAWKVEPAGQPAAAPVMGAQFTAQQPAYTAAPQQPAYAAPATSAAPAIEQESTDDLPF